MFSLPKPRVFCWPFQGCRVPCLAGTGAGFWASGAASVAGATSFARLARSASSSLIRWHCLYFLPEPQWHGSLRPSSRRVGSAKILLRASQSSLLSRGTLTHHHAITRTADRERPFLRQRQGDGDPHTACCPIV